MGGASELAREKGNAAYRREQWHEAIQWYTEVRCRTHASASTPSLCVRPARRVRSLPNQVAPGEADADGGGTCALAFATSCT